MEVIVAAEVVPVGEGAGVARMFQGGGVTFARMTMRPGGKVGDHSSDARLCVYVERGRIIYVSCGESRVCEKGSLIVDEPGNIHSLENVSDADSVLLIVKIER